LRYAVFGKIKSINLDSTIIDFTGLDTSALAGLLLANPDFAGSDGLRVWRLSEADVRGLRQFFKEKPGQILYSVRDTTGDNTECGTYSGQTAFINGTQQKFGLNVDLLASIRNGTTDLTAVFSFSEAITNSTGGAGDSPYHGAVTVQTNLDFAGRFQLPKEMAGVFVLSAAPASTNHKRIALLLTSSVLQSKK